MSQWHTYWPRSTPHTPCPPPTVPSPLPTAHCPLPTAFPVPLPPPPACPKTERARLPFRDTPRLPFCTVLQFWQLLPGRVAPEPSARGRRKYKQPFILSRPGPGSAIPARPCRTARHITCFVTSLARPAVLHWLCKRLGPIEPPRFAKGFTARANCSQHPWNRHLLRCEGGERYPGRPGERTFSR